MPCRRSVPLPCLTRCLDARRPRDCGRAQSHCPACPETSHERSCQTVRPHRACGDQQQRFDRPSQRAGANQHARHRQTEEVINVHQIADGTDQHHRFRLSCLPYQHGCVMAVKERTKQWSERHALHTVAGGYPKTGSRSDSVASGTANPMKSAMRVDNNSDGWLPRPSRSRWSKVDSRQPQVIESNVVPLPWSMRSVGTLPTQASRESNRQRRCRKAPPADGRGACARRAAAAGTRSRSALRSPMTS